MLRFSSFPISLPPALSGLSDRALERPAITNLPIVYGPPRQSSRCRLPVTCCPCRVSRRPVLVLNAKNPDVLFLRTPRICDPGSIPSVSCQLRLPIHVWWAKQHDCGLAGHYNMLTVRERARVTTPFPSPCGMDLLSRLEHDATGGRVGNARPKTAWFCQDLQKRIGPRDWHRTAPARMSGPPVSHRRNPMIPPGFLRPGRDLDSSNCTYITFEIHLKTKMDLFRGPFVYSAIPFFRFHRKSVDQGVGEDLPGEQRFGDQAEHDVGLFAKDVTLPAADLGILQHHVDGKAVEQRRRG